MQISKKSIAFEGTIIQWQSESDRLLNIPLLLNTLSITMRVQLSPWEILETSVNFPVEKRRKRSKSNGRKSGENHSSASVHDGLAIAASFVAGRRPRHSKKARHARSPNVEDLLPALVLTLEHRIAVVGKKGPSSQGADWQESSLFQYASRPGRSTSFLQSDGSSTQNVRTPAFSMASFVSNNIYTHTHNTMNIYTIQKVS